MCLLVWQKNCQGFRQFGGFSKTLSSLNHLYLSPSLSFSPPLRRSHPSQFFLGSCFLRIVLVLICKKIARASASFGVFQFFFLQGNGASGPQIWFPGTLFDDPVPNGNFLFVPTLIRAVFFTGEENARASASCGDFQKKYSLLSLPLLSDSDVRLLSIS